MLNCSVISLVPFDIREEKPGLIPPRYFIPASVNDVPQILQVGNATHYVYLDETRGYLRVVSPAELVVKSLVDDYCSAQLGIFEDAQPALFWEEGEWTISKVLVGLKDKIQDARQKQRNWFLNCCKIADDDWQKYHQHNVISSTQRKMADIIGWRSQEHEWMSPLTTMESSPCPSCGLTIPKSVVVCSNCRCVIDAEKYKKLQYAGA